MGNLASNLEATARALPDAPALILGDSVQNWAGVNRMASQVAGGLAALGVRPGDRVAISCPNLPAFPVVFYGILKAGAIAVPLNPLLKPDELTDLLRSCGASVLFCPGNTPELRSGDTGRLAARQAGNCRLVIIPPGPAPEQDEGEPGEISLPALCANGQGTEQAVQVLAGDTAVIILTSGTTGKPRGIELSHCNLMMNAAVCQQISGMSAHDRQLVVLPLFHGFAMSVQMNTAVFSGCAMVLMPRFRPEQVLSLLERVTLFAGVPALYGALARLIRERNHDTSAIRKSLRLAVSGGSAMPRELDLYFRESLGIPLIEGYGLSETSPLTSLARPDGTHAPGSVGKPVAGVAVAIVDSEGREVPPGTDGEIIVRGHNVMKGYYNDPGETGAVLRNGWLFTGDAGRTDADGNLYVIDRLKDLVIRGGYNIYPAEIEAVLLRHPRIAIAAVTGVPDPLLGEELVACIVPRDDWSDAGELGGWLRERLANYKRPRRFRFFRTLPLTATGKVMKGRVREMLETDRLEELGEIPP